MAEINKPTGVNKLWAEGGVRIAPSDAKYSLGHVVEKPAYQVENFLQNKNDTTLAHINQHGLPVWDGETEYQIGKSWTLGSDGSLYYCKSTHSNQNPVLDVAEVYWRKVLDGTKVVPSAAISSFALQLLDDMSAASMRSTLGGTTVGQQIFTAPTALSARSTLGATSVGHGLFTAGTQGAALDTLGFPPFAQYLTTLNLASEWRSNIGANNAANLDTGTLPAARLPAATESTIGGVIQATQTEVNSGSNTTKYVTPAKMRLGASSSLGTNGFLKLPSWLFGFEIRWGVVSVVGNSFTSTGDIFTTACLQGVCSLGTATDVDRQAPNCVPSGRSLVLYNPDGGVTLTIRYIAVGY